MSNDAPSPDEKQSLSLMESSSMDVTQTRSGSHTDHPSFLVDPLLCEPEKVVEAYGFWGRYQWWTAIQCCSVMFIYAANMHIVPFINDPSRVDCLWQNETNSVLYNDMPGCVYRKNRQTPKVEFVCGETTGTTILEYKDHQPITSKMHEFGLHCASNFAREGGQTAFSMGAMLVVPLFSYFADHSGRKYTFLIAVFGSIVANFCCVIAPTYWYFITLRFIVGALSDSYYTIGANFVCELFTEEQRSFAGLLGTVFWSLGILFLGVLTQFETNWRLLYLWMTLPSLICFGMIFTLPESPHWAIQHHNRERIRNYISSANKCNRKRLDMVSCLRENPNEKHEKVNIVKALLKMVKSLQMWKIMIIASLMSFMMNFTYFAISLEAVDLSEDRFTAYMWNGVADLPGSALAIPLLHFFGRKWVAIVSGLLCGVFLVIAPFFEWYENGWLKVALILTSKFCNNITQTLIPVWFPEMLPTSIRVIGFSIINFPQCIGQVLAPFFRHLKYDWAPTKYVAVGSGCIACSLLTMLLNDTKGQYMPGDVRDVAPTQNSITSRSASNDRSRSNSVSDN
ncbi:unnamed protein product, partial [Mesorhabditis spiculigera]